MKFLSSSAPLKHKDSQFEGEIFVLAEKEFHFHFNSYLLGLSLESNNYYIWMDLRQIIFN